MKTFMILIFSVVLILVEPTVQSVQMGVISDEGSQMPETLKGSSELIQIEVLKESEGIANASRSGLNNSENGAGELIEPPPKDQPNGASYLLKYYTETGCGGNLIFSSTTGLCYSISWTILLGSSCYSGKGWKTIVSSSGSSTSLISYGYSSSDCSGSSSFTITYPSNSTIGCYGYNNYALSFASMVTSSTRVTSSSSMIFYSGSSCSGSQLGTLGSSGTCSSLNWTIIVNGLVYSGYGIDVDWFDTTFNLNFYSTSSCSTLVKSWSGKTSGCYLPPTGEQLYINGILTPSFLASHP